MKHLIIFKFWFVTILAGDIASKLRIRAMMPGLAPEERQHLLAAADHLEGKGEPHAAA